MGPMNQTFGYFPVLTIKTGMPLAMRGRVHERKR
jgi:hypothetical protein